MATPPEGIVPGAGGGSEHVSVTARDPVIVTPFEDGGLISYRKADGLFLHTLNTRKDLNGSYVSSAFVERERRLTAAHVRRIRNALTWAMSSVRP